MSKIRDSLRRLIGRIKKMSIWREVLLVLFATLFATFFSGLTVILNPSIREAYPSTMPFIYASMSIIVGISFGLLYWARAIENKQKEDESNQRKSELKQFAKELGKELAKDLAKELKK